VQSTSTFVGIVLCLLCNTSTSGVMAGNILRSGDPCRTLGEIEAHGGESFCI
jgi:hypothetical protein